jgi:integrase
MKTEINPSASYRQAQIQILCYLSSYHNSKILFSEMTRDDIINYLDNLRRPEYVDPMHKWIGTYNTRRVYLMRFFKWLYSASSFSPTTNDPASSTLIPQDKRPTPEVVKNIPKLKRKEKSIYKPSDLWTEEDDLLFLKYSGNKRDKAYHMLARDSSCRPSEILNLRIKDLNFKLSPDGTKQYAEIMVNGKTGTRSIPLFNSLPYVKDWLDDHPLQTLPKAHLIPSLDTRHRKFGHRLNALSLNSIYRKYKSQVFPVFLEDPKVPPEDKQKINDLLKKPWNPYIRRHSALTQKAQVLREPLLKAHAGWSPSSQMHLKYEHWYGNESAKALLEASGVFSREDNNPFIDSFKPKQCPNCNESNIANSKFCSKCRMVLNYDSYNETIENAQQKDDEIKTIKEQIQALILAVSSMKDQNQINNYTHQLFNAGILQVSKSSPEK